MNAPRDDDRVVLPPDIRRIAENSNFSDEYLGSVVRARLLGLRVVEQGGHRYELRGDWS